MTQLVVPGRPEGPAPARLNRARHTGQGRRLEVTIDHEGVEGVNLVTVVGTVPYAKFFDYAYGDENGRGADNELYACLDDEGILVDLICDGIRRFQQFFGLTKRYHIEVSCRHGTGELLSFQMEPHKN